MFRQINKIQNVSGLKIHNNIIYYNQNGNLFQEDINILKNVEGNSFWFINEGIYFHNEEGERLYQQKNKIHEINIPLFPNSNFKQGIFCRVNFRREDRKWNWELGVYDLDRNILTKKFKIQNFNSEMVFNAKAIGFFNRESLAAINIENGEIEWNLKFKEKVYIIIGVYKEYALLPISNHELAAINLTTGKIAKKWQELPGINPNTQHEGVIPESKSFVLDKESGKLLGAFYKNYIEIDLKTNAIHFKDITEELQKHKIIFIKQLNNNPFTHTHLFLTAMMQQDANDTKWSKDCLFALNRETLKIDWLHVFEEQNLGTNIPKKTENNLYQLDNDENLFVFERT